MAAVTRRLACRCPLAEEEEEEEVSGVKIDT